MCTLLEMTFYKRYGPFLTFYLHNEDELLYKKDIN